LREAQRSAALASFFFICAVVELQAQLDRGEPFELHAQSDDREPFGLVKIVAPEGPTKREWRKIMTNVKAEVHDLERCRAQPGRCKRAEQEFEAIVNDARNRQGRARIVLVNERINGKIRYKSDKAESGVEDTWNLALAALSPGMWATVKIMRSPNMQHFIRLEHLTRTYGSYWCVTMLCAKIMPFSLSATKSNGSSSTIGGTGSTRTKSYGSSSHFSSLKRMAYRYFPKCSD